MRRLLENWKWKLQRFLYGRYGMDELTATATFVSLALWFLALLFSIRYLSTAAFVIMLWACWRCYSKNIPKRRQENDTFLRAVQKPKNWFGLQKNCWRDRKTHKYFHCSSCKTVLRVPKGRGMIEITCPKCRTVMRKKT